MTHKNEATPAVLEASRDELLAFATNYNTAVLIIPSRALWSGGNIPAERRAHEEFVRMLREAGLPVLDLRPELEKTGDPTSHYFKNDPHWNVRGHALAAEALVEFFSRQKAWAHLLKPAP